MYLLLKTIIAWFEIFLAKLGTIVYDAVNEPTERSPF
jgi:hypothetical protein